MIFRLSRCVFAVFLAISVIGFAAARAADQKIVVFAAASMKNALDAANQQWVKQGHSEVTVSYAASSTLANQIEKGAPADVFISADLDWMNFLKSKNQMKPDSISNFLGNRLVVIAPASKNNAGQIKEIATGKEFADLLPASAGEKIAIGTVDAVPAGKYGKAALAKLGVWDKISGSVAQTESVRAALLLVSRGEAALGIVYQTDAAADKNVTVIGLFPQDSHPPIIYPIGITADSKNPDVTAYLAYLRSDQARPIFEAQGFTVLSQDQN